MKLREGQAILEGGGHLWKHIVITLTAQQSIADLRESPGAWVAVQANRQMMLRRGDKVTIISGDGNTISDSHVVLRAEAGQVELSKPLRLISLVAGVLFTNGHMEVVAAGVGYSIRSVRDGCAEDRIYQSVDAAKQAIFKRQPVAVT